MQTRNLGILSLTALALTIVWLVLLIGRQAAFGAVTSFEQALTQAASLDLGYYLTYLNAALITIVVVLLFAGLYVFCRQYAPQAAVMGFAFVPVYAVFNLFVYLSQISIVPRLMLSSDSAALLLLGQLLQSWPYSAAALFNNLAYGLLGISSIAFGGVLARARGVLRAGGILLILNGIACIVGAIGSLAGSPSLAMGSVVGGVIFLLALGCLSWAFLWGE
jgi:hypothetical protein